MGYTHYWTQTRDFTRDEWVQIHEDMEALLKDVQHVQGIPLANGMGDPGTSPEVTDQKIWFNGAGDEACETFCLYRVRPPKEPGERRGWDFCKTARRPYDLAVTAALCHLASVTDPISHSVGSDGNGRDFLDGLAEARRALPRYANILEIPMGILKRDRWCMPWVSCYESSGFDVKFCVDGKGYVEHIKTGDWYYRDASRARAVPGQDQGGQVPAPAEGALRHPRRRRRKRRAEHLERVRQLRRGPPRADRDRAGLRFGPLFDSRYTPDVASHLQKPPAYVRPGDMPEPETRH
jgi:hypothetical protein